MTAPIGVFDSGHGGLTVLRALTEALPTQDFLYLGDHAAAPYGNRSPEEIYARSESAVALLFALGCSLVLLACNTAAAIALRPLQQGWLAARYPERRVLGVLVPLVEALTGVAWNAPQPGAGTARHVALFATPRTVESGAFPREAGLRAPNLKVSQEACPSLAAAIEADAAANELASLVETPVARLLARCRDDLPDAAALACTHYPLVETLFRAALPPSVRILSQPALVAESLGAYLQRHPAFAGGEGRLRFLTTGDPLLVTPLATRFFRRPAVFDAIRG